MIKTHEVISLFDLIFLILLRLLKVITQAVIKTAMNKMPAIIPRINGMVGEISINY